MAIPIPNDWDGEYCCYSVEWPKSKQYLAILRGLIDSAASGRFYLSDTGNIIQAQEIIRATFDYNFRNEEVLMACNDATAAALNNIATAIRNQTTVGGGGNCCGGSTGGGGLYPPEPGGDDTTNENPDIDPPPDGYPDWETFYAQKCGVATQILEEVQASLGNMTILLISGLSVEALVELLLVALTLTISTAGVAAIAGLLLTLGGVVICATALSILNDNFDELLCSLLLGTNSSTSRANFLAKWSEVVDGASVDPLEGFAIKQIMAYLVGFEEVNRMYIPNSSVDYSGYECPNCNPDCFEFDEDLQGFVVQDDGGGSGLVLTWDDGNMSYVTPSDLTHMPQIERNDLTYEIKEGDVFSFCFTEDPTPWGADFQLRTSEGPTIQLEDSGTIVDHVTLRCYDLTAWVGYHVQDIVLGWNRAGSGEWLVSAIGFNCPCTIGQSCFTPPPPE